ncbi:hypothetical protein ACOMHN_063237 [Nucella lapillus]
MVRQKWELQYPVFLFLVLATLLAPTAPFPKVDLSRDCQTCESVCKNKTLQVLSSVDGSCMECGCIANTDVMTKFRITHPPKTPFIYSQPVLTNAGGDVEFSCIRWCSTQNCSNVNVRNEMSLKSGSSLPDARQQKVYKAQADGIWMSILNLTITVDSANTLDVLRCRALGETSFSKAATYTLFAFGE